MQQQQTAETQVVGCCTISFLIRFDLDLRFIRSSSVGNSIIVGQLSAFEEGDLFINRMKGLQVIEMGGQRVGYLSYTKIRSNMSCS
jgi:hypothetical protein